MKLKLSSDDRSAIDLLLNETVSASGASAQGYAQAGGAQHLQAVRRVFGLLQVLPAAEPPADLVSRTLARVGQSSGQVFTSSAARAGADGRAQPLA